MPFTSLTDPVDLARAQAALDAAWNIVRAGVPEAEQERERTKLAYIVASFAHAALDEAASQRWRWIATASVRDHA